MLANDATKLHQLCLQQFFLSIYFYIQMRLCSSNITALKNTVTHVFTKVFFNQEHSTSQFGICKCQEKLSNSKSKLIIQANLSLYRVNLKLLLIFFFKYSYFNHTHIPQSSIPCSISKVTVSTTLLNYVLSKLGILIYCILNPIEMQCKQAI